MQKIICGIQQMGVGVSDLKQAWDWYERYFKMNVCIFEEEATAEYMLHYTEGKPRKRHAVLAINMHGGGGFEIWQHKDKTPEFPVNELNLGDLGINICKMKTHKILELFDLFKAEKLNVLSPLIISPNNKKMFFVKDPWSNIFQFVEESNVFINDNNLNGGCFGVIIGVTDIEKSLKLYQDILGFDKIIYDEIDDFKDFINLPGGNERFRRVLLSHSEKRKGAFSELLGPGEIELIQKVNTEKRKSIYENRIWGDPGFIHLCFDIRNMAALREECSLKGFPFTVDSAEKLHKTFDMGDAAGNFAYVSDPDGTPIEFVETFKIPVVKKLGFFIKLDKNKPEKRLPKFMLRFLKFQKRKSR